MEKFLVLLLMVSACVCVSVGKEERKKVPEESRMLPIRIEKSSSKRHTEDILRHMGMAKVRGPGGAHRKRLASRPRVDKAAPQDSHVYLIKLPPNRFYYEKHPVFPSDPRFNRIPVDFKSNGKPAKVYHWNLPMVKKAQSKKANQVLKWAREEKMAENKRVSYFRPKKPSKQAFQKFFPGNGKPHSLYVIERSHSKH